MVCVFAPLREISCIICARLQYSSTVIQGLISLEMRTDHVYMHLIESALFNKGKTKVYAGVPGNLVAYACRLSFQKGFEGNVSFLSKSQLVEHI